MWCMSIGSEDSRDFIHMLSEITEDLEVLDDSINEYKLSARTYKETVEQYKDGKASEPDVKKAMDQFAFVETEVVRKAYQIGGFTESIQSDLQDSRPEDVVGLAREIVFMDHKIDEMSDNYSIAGDDFLESLEGFKEMYGNAVSKGDRLRKLDQETIDNDIGYSWREAFANVKNWKENNADNVFDPETIAGKRNEIISERPNGRYIDFQSLSGTEDIAEKRMEVLGISDEELESKRNKIRNQEPRYIQ